MDSAADFVYRIHQIRSFNASNSRLLGETEEALEDAKRLAKVLPEVKFRWSEALQDNAADSEFSDDHMALLQMQ